jgi:hypothetical protein
VWFCGSVKELVTEIFFGECDLCEGELQGKKEKKWRAEEGFIVANRWLGIKRERAVTGKRKTQSKCIGPISAKEVTVQKSRQLSRNKESPIPQLHTK